MALSWYILQPRQHTEHGGRAVSSGVVSISLLLAVTLVFCTSSNNNNVLYVYEISALVQKDRPKAEEQQSQTFGPESQMDQIGLSAGGSLALQQGIQCYQVHPGLV